MHLEGFREEAFTHEGKTRAVYRRGAGPGVVVMHEIPGIHPGMISFASRVADAGFSVAMPVMFGTPGKPVSTGYMLEQVLHACVSREFRLLAARKSSPITDWLRALPQPPRRAGWQGGRRDRNVPDGKLRAGAHG